MTPVDQDRLLDLIAAWDELRSEGKSAKPDELCPEDPTLQAVLAERIARRLQIEPMIRPPADRLVSDSCRTLCKDEFPENSSERDSTIIPERIGRYRVERLLGKGGFGQVFLAFDDELIRYVAIKVPHRELVSRSENAEAYRREARAVATLEHPNIVPVYDVGVSEKYQCFVVSKYVEGSTLFTQMNQSRLPFAESVRLIATLADALHYAHTHGVVHRDVKPANIVISKEGEPFLVDFGLALREQDLDSARRFAGTPAYMSPEQAQGSPVRVDGRSDIFSLGVVLYELLVGFKPFRSECNSDLLAKIATAVPKLPRQIVNEIPEDIERCCMKALAKEANSRYATAREFADDLRESLKQSFLKTQTETRRGRAALQLEDRAAQWSVQQHGRFLPNTIDYLRIRLFTDSKSWTSAQQKLMAKAKKRICFRGIGLLAALLLIAFGIWQQKSNQMIERDKMAIKGVLNGSLDSVPAVLKELQEFPAEAVRTELRELASNAEGDRRRQIAYVQSEFDDIDISYLVSQIDVAPKNEAGTLIVALGHSPKNALDAIRVEIEKCRQRDAFDRMARLSLVALYLGNVKPASDMCRIEDRPDPIQRTWFIESFCRWQGDVVELVPFARVTDDKSLRSAICLGLAGMPLDSVTEKEKAAWNPLISDWFQTAEDGVTHSAAGLPLLYWGLEIPLVESMKRADSSRNWYVNSVGMTMMTIPPRQVSSDGTKAIPGPPLTFLISDREVAIWQFFEFMSDPRCPITEKPSSAPPYAQPIPSFPVHQITWYDAVIYCNWLSRKEGFTPCYERTGRKDHFGLVEWQFVENRDGYHLPSGAQWEYACRAGTTTPYSFGSEQFKTRYANLAMTDLDHCAIRFPNGWGLFDMHGNVAEWSNDSRPNVTTVTQRIQTIRGGDGKMSIGSSRSELEHEVYNHFQMSRLGFRVARVFPEANAVP